MPAQKQRELFIEGRVAKHRICIVFYNKTF